MRLWVCANHQLLIWVRMIPLPGMASGRMTSHADSRSLATNSSASPRSKISRTLPEARRGKGRPSMEVTAIFGRAAAISAKFMDYSSHQGRKAGKGQADFHANRDSIIPAGQRQTHSVPAKESLL